MGYVRFDSGRWKQEVYSFDNVFFMIFALADFVSILNIKDYESMKHGDLHVFK
jgi:hypothetical protein